MTVNAEEGAIMSVVRDASAFDGISVVRFEVPKSYDLAPLYEMERAGISVGSSANQTPLHRRQQVERYYDNVLKAIRRVASDACITKVDERVIKLPIYLDMGGPIWNTSSISLLHVPCLSLAGVGLYAKQIRMIMRQVACVEPAMITKLLVGCAASPSLREYLQGKRVAALGWESGHDKGVYPCISYEDDPRLTIEEDPLPPNTLFAY